MKDVDQASDKLDDELTDYVKELLQSMLLYNLLPHGDQRIPESLRGGTGGPVPKISDALISLLDYIEGGAPKNISRRIHEICDMAVENKGRCLDDSEVKNLEGVVVYGGTFEEGDGRDSHGRDSFELKGFGSSGAIQDALPKFDPAKAILLSSILELLGDVSQAGETVDEELKDYIKELLDWAVHKKLIDNKDNRIPLSFQDNSVLLRPGLSDTLITLLDYMRSWYVPENISGKIKGICAMAVENNAQYLDDSEIKDLKKAIG